MKINEDLVGRVKNRIVRDWTRDRGCCFEVRDGDGVAWDVTVFASDKWDCWCRKSGTLGQQRRTFARFDARTGQ